MSWNDPALMLALRRGRARLARELGDGSPAPKDAGKELPSPAGARPPFPRLAWPWGRREARRRPGLGRRAEKQPG